MHSKVSFCADFLFVKTFRVLNNNWSVAMQWWAAIMAAACTFIQFAVPPEDRTPGKSPKTPARADKKLENLERPRTA